jgi:hypothetical protein
MRRCVQYEIVPHPITPNRTHGLGDTKRSPRISSLVNLVLGHARFGLVDAAEAHVASELAEPVGHGSEQHQRQRRQGKPSGVYRRDGAARHSTEQYEGNECEPST